MNTYCATFSLRPDQVTAYRELHIHCWKEQREALKNAGAKNLEIFMQENGCIIVYTCENFDAFLEKLEASPVNKRWQDQVNCCFSDTVELTGNQKIVPLEKIFSLTEAVG